MAIALTQTRIVYRQFLASTRLSLINEINSALQVAGWTSTAVTGGYRLLGVSPQGLGIYLYVRDLGHTYFDNPNFLPQVTFNFTSLDGLSVGMDHEIVTGLGTYQVITGCCYLWLSVRGTTFHPAGSHLGGGIPYLPGIAPCEGSIPAAAAPAQVFWCMSDGSNDVGPRNSLILNGTMAHSEALWGTSYCAPGNLIGSVRIPTLTAASAIFGGFDYPSPMLWRNGNFFNIEPMLVWGLANDIEPKIRGQIYDAMIFTKKTAMDVERVADVTGGNFKFINFTHDYTYGGLNLILPTGRSSSGRANYAYFAN